MMDAVYSVLGTGWTVESFLYELSVWHIRDADNKPCQTNLCNFRCFTLFPPRYIKKDKDLIYIHFHMHSVLAKSEVQPLIFLLCTISDAPMIGFFFSSFTQRKLCERSGVPFTYIMYKNDTYL